MARGVQTARKTPGGAQKKKVQLASKTASKFGSDGSGKMGKKAKKAAKREKQRLRRLKQHGIGLPSADALSDAEGDAAADADGDAVSLSVDTPASPSGVADQELEID